jgi:hypothetical protein
MSDRPTPETDASRGYALSSHYGRLEGSYLQMDRSGPFIHAEVSRKLERERDEAMERCVKLESAMSYSGQGKHLLDRFLQAVKERDEAKEELSKLTGTHLSVAISERNDALNQIQGWENKWKAAVEMAAIAENKVSDLEDQVDLAMKVIKRLEANQP